MPGVSIRVNKRGEEGTNLLMGISGSEQTTFSFHSIGCIQKAALICSDFMSSCLLSWIIWMQTFLGGGSHLQWTI
jgi:hypothetical protein